VHDGKYVKAQRRLQSSTKTLCTYQAVNRRSCSANEANEDGTQHARNRQKHCIRLIPRRFSPVGTNQVRRPSLRCSWTSSREHSADGPQSAGLVIQPFWTIASVKLHLRDGRTDSRWESNLVHFSRKMRHLVAIILTNFLIID